jgi:hypothetical protein
VRPSQQKKKQLSWGDFCHNRASCAMGDHGKNMDFPAIFCLMPWFCVKQYPP